MYELLAALGYTRSLIMLVVGVRGTRGTRGIRGIRGTGGSIPISYGEVLTLPPLHASSLSQNASISCRQGCVVHALFACVGMHV